MTLRKRITELENEIGKLQTLMSVNETARIAHLEYKMQDLLAKHRTPQLRKSKFFLNEMEAIENEIVLLERISNAKTNPQKLIDNLIRLQNELADAQSK